MGSVVSSDTGVRAPVGDPLGMQWLQAHVHVGRTYPLIAVRVCRLGDTALATDDEGVLEATAFALALARLLDLEGASLSGLEVDAQLRGQAGAGLRLKVSGAVPADMDLAALARRVLEEEADAQRWLAGVPVDISVQLVGQRAAGGAAVAVVADAGDAEGHAGVSAEHAVAGGETPDAAAEDELAVAEDDVEEPSSHGTGELSPVGGETLAAGGGAAPHGLAHGVRWPRRLAHSVRAPRVGLVLARPRRAVLGGALAVLAVVALAVGWGALSDGRGSSGGPGPGEPRPVAEVANGVAVQAEAPVVLPGDAAASAPQTPEATISAPAAATVTPPVDARGANAREVVADPGQASPIAVAGARAPDPGEPTAVALTAAPSPLIDFTPERAGNFSWRSDPRSVAWFAGDGYHLGARQPGRFVAIGVLLTQEPGKVLVSATFHKVGGPTGGGYGIILADRGPQTLDGLNQRGSYLVFEVGDKGEVGVWRREDDRWVDILTWTPTPAVNPNRGENTLEAGVSAGGLSFSVNGTAIPISTPPVSIASTGGVGLFLGGDDNEAVLTRLTVTQPD